MNIARLKAKVHAGEIGADGGALAAGENPFSTNKVTGWSLNYPIVATCAPSKVCAETCYFAKGPATWTAALAKQYRLYNSTVADPSGTAALIAHHARRMRLSFVRWNGGGDLFRESVECINAAAKAMPEIPQWVVTRLAHHAVNLEPLDNVFVHFSVDRSSWARVAAMRQWPGKWFWSYQVAADEIVPNKGEPGTLAPVIFHDGYDPGRGVFQTSDDCPLNWRDDIAGTCESCRRCFNGDAVSRATEMRHVLDSLIGG